MGSMRLIKAIAPFTPTSLLEGPPLRADGTGLIQLAPAGTALRELTAVPRDLDRLAYEIFARPPRKKDRMLLTVGARVPADNILPGALMLSETLPPDLDPHYRTGVYLCPKIWIERGQGWSVGLSQFGDKTKVIALVYDLFEILPWNWQLRSPAGKKSQKSAA